jgi:hypothetical protein
MRFFLIILVCISCGQRKLTIADLKFPDPEKNGIVKNRVSEMLGVPSMQISGVDTTFRSTYDKIGRTVSASLNPGEEKDFWYDSLNLPDSLYERRWDVSIAYKIIPTFDEATTVLYMYYFDPHFKADRYVEKLTFDHEGNLAQVDRHYLKHTAFRNIPAFKALKTKPEYTAMYFYDARKRLVKDSTDSEYVAVHKYYYSDQLDSMVYTRSDRVNFNEEQRTYYDKNELRKSTMVKVQNGTSQYAYTVAYYYKTYISY